MTSLSRLICVLLVLAAATSAQAFEVERSGGTPAEAASPKPGVVATEPGSVKKKPSQGTEVRIPGLGRIGVLPKLDFGLELLYGSKDRSGSTTTEAPKASENEDGSFRIRGSIKHRF